MKNLQYLIAAAVILFCCSSCKKKEAALEPSDIEIQYKLPQGNHDYDPKLVELSNKYGSFFLYKFSPVDFTYNPVFVSPGFAAQYSAEMADEAYVGKALDFLLKNWLNYYNDDFLKANLPFKVLLGQNLKSKSIPVVNYTVLTNYNQITLGNFSAAFDQMTDLDKKTYLNNLNTTFWTFIGNRNKLEIPGAFSALSNYTLTTVTAANMYSFGFIFNINGQDNKPVKDFLSYITAITSKSKAELDATILKPTTDVNGLIKKKYDIIINYYKQKYNMDLQVIGNASIK